MSEKRKWDGFIKEISNVVFFWFFGIVFFTLFRISFILIYHKELGNNIPISDFISSMFMGFRFDCTSVGYFIILPFAFTLFLSYFEKFNLIRKVRIVCQYIFVILSTLICLITINYYKEFNEQFNNFVFLGLDDDKQAILDTIVQYYNPILNVFLLIAISVISLLLFRYFEDKTRIYNLLSKIKSKYARVGLVILLLFLCISGLRGTFTNPPAIRKWASVSMDPFLNKTIINPYRSLKYAYSDYTELNGISSENPFEKNITTLFDTDKVSNIIKKEARGETIEKPKQIFIVIMESYDSWPLMDKYLPLGLSNNLNEIAHKGLHFSNFIPAYNATFYAYGTIIAGIPFNGINISRVGTMSDVYLSSIFSQFKELGYKTNMFYGGFLSWENIGNFTTHMGCDKVYSGIDAGGKSDSGVWGVEDDKLFDLALRSIDPEEYTFNVILTSSYHAPYVVDVDSKGFMYQSTSQIPEEMKQYYDGGMNLTELGHLWYGDWAIGRFMDEADSKYENSMFAFTGDHYGRRFINHSPNLYEKSSVPFILYGKNIPQEHNLTPGSHIDIAPTMIELIAPKGFMYYSFGSSLLLPEKKNAIAFQKIIDTDSIYFAPKDARVSKISLVDFGEDQADRFKYEEEYKKTMALSWHYIMRGDSLNIKNNLSMKKR